MPDWPLAWPFPLIMRNVLRNCKEGAIVCYQLFARAQIHICCSQIFLVNDFKDFWTKTRSLFCWYLHNSALVVKHPIDSSPRGVRTVSSPPTEMWLVSPRLLEVTIATHYLGIDKPLLSQWVQKVMKQLNFNCGLNLIWHQFFYQKILNYKEKLDSYLYITTYLTNFCPTWAQLTISDHLIQTSDA